MPPFKMFCLSEAVKVHGTDKWVAINPPTIREAKAGRLATIQNGFHSAPCIVTILTCRVSEDHGGTRESKTRMSLAASG